MVICASVVFVVPFVSFVSPLMSGCNTAPARAEAPDRPAVVWRTLGSWSGDGSRQTESFDVSSGALRLTWKTRPTGTDDGHFRVWLYSAISGRPLQLFVDRSGAGSGTAHLADDPRTSYLVVESERLNWEASLEEAMATGARSRVESE